MKTANAFIGCLLGLLMASHVSASYIQIIPTIAAPDMITSGKVEFPVSVINNGDESAYDIRLSLIISNGFTSSTVFYRELKPKEQRNDVLTLDIENGTIQGTYVAALLTNYADANRYPFSSINPLIINYKVNTVSRIYGSIGDVNLNQGPENTRLTIINHDDRPRTVNVMPLIPDELKMSLPGLEYTINPNEEKDIPITISSSGALQGSTYPVFVKITYTENGQYYSSIIRGMVRINDTKQSGKMQFSLWIPIAGLAVLLAFLLFKKLKTNKKKGRR
jgi:hypothetical protein